MSEIAEAAISVKESVSTVFRHILPGLLIISISTLSVPGLLLDFDLSNTGTLIILGALAMVIGNVWYVFHRYTLLQFVDFVAYYFRWPGKPRRIEKCDFRRDIGRHVSSFFGAIKLQPSMGKHIRDRFSSFNFMYIFSEALFLFTLFAKNDAPLAAIRSYCYVVSAFAFIAATWQYSIVRCIDGEFVSQELPYNNSLNPTT